MRNWFRLSVVSVSVLILSLTARAQDAEPAPAPGPAQAASQGSYPDIDSLREPGSSAKLFPAQPADQTPGATTQGNPTGTGRRNNALLNNNQRRRNTRRNDVLTDQADSDPLDVRVAYRRAKTLAMARDPGLAELLREADAAPTDVQKRALLKVYYTRLFGEVRKVDRSPAMKKHVELLGDVAKQRYDPQRRVVGGEEDIIRGGGGRRGRAR